MLRETDLAAVTEAFYARADAIPFGNSDYQNAVFVEAAGITPERAYRAVLLNLNERLEALRSAYYNLKREDVEIRRLEAKIAADGVNEFDREIAVIDLEEKRIQRRQTEKLVKDALHTASFWESQLQKYPAFTREQFEAAEPDHWTFNLSRQELGLSGASMALANIQQDAPRLQAVLKALGPAKEQQP